MIAKYFTVYSLSMLKFVFGPTTALALGLSVLESIIFTVLGMMTSVVVISYLGSALRNKLMLKLRGNRKVFTTKSRKVVTIWKKFGVQGVAFFTPILFTPIFGTIIAAAFGETPKRIMFFMFLSAVFWGVILSFLVLKLGNFAIDFF